MSKLTLPPRPTGLVIFESVVSLMLIIVAVFGNSLILAALSRNRCLRNTTNIYIAALAISDLLNAFIPGTLFASSIISGRLVFSSFGCRLSGFLVHYLTYVSMATMTLTAVNRYYRVVKPQHYKRLFSFKRSLIILGAIWLVVAAFVLYPQAFSRADFSFSPVLTFCAYRFASGASEIVFTTVVICIFVLFGFSLICVSYYRVSRVIRQHNNYGVSHFRLHGVTTREINLTKVLFALVLAFALCWLPTFGVVLIIRVFLAGKAPHLLGAVIPFLMQTSSAVNPLIYGFMSPSFRREFKLLLLFQREDLSLAADGSYHLRAASSRPEKDTAFVVYDNIVCVGDVRPVEVEESGRHFQT